MLQQYINTDSSTANIPYEVWWDKRCPSLGIPRSWVPVGSADNKQDCQ